MFRPFHGQKTRDTLMYWLTILSGEMRILKIPDVCSSTFLPSHYDVDQNVIVINPHQLKSIGAHPAVVMAHELRHAWQMQNGLLVPGSRWGHYVWRGGEEILAMVGSIEEHEALPWEADAIQYEKKFAARAGLPLIR
jgi:hypothetical protein